MLSYLDRGGIVTDSVSVTKDMPILVRDAMTKQISYTRLLTNDPGAHCPQHGSGALVMFMRSSDQRT
jgi:hypothetical protein